MKLTARLHLSEYGLSNSEMISTLEMLHDWKASDFSLDSVEASIYAMWNMIFFGKFFASMIPEDEVRLKLFDFY